MEKKFTPGPWMQSHREIPNDEDGMYATQVYTPDGETIATLAWYPMPKKLKLVEGVERYVIDTYRDANAALIASAPDLLEALERLVEMFKGEPNTESAIEQANAAISKALSMKK